MGLKLTAIIMGGLMFASAGLYVARRPIASWSIERYLAGRGIQSSVVIEQLGFGNAIAQIRLGPPASPDLTIARLGVAYGWRISGPYLKAADLFRPMLRVRYDGRSLSLGALQALTGSATERSPVPNVAPATATKDTGPAITAQNAQLRIETPAGVLQTSGFANFSGGRVRTLYASAQPVTLKAHGLTAELRSAVLWQDANGRLHTAVTGEFTSADKQRRIAANGLSATLGITRLNWSRQTDGSLRIAAHMQAELDANELEARGVVVTGAQIHFEAQGNFDTNGDTDVTGSLTASSIMPEDRAQAQAAAVPILGSDPAQREALAAALRNLSLHVNGFRILRSAGQTYVALAEPAEISGDGATLTLSAYRGPLAHAFAGVVRGMGELNLQATHLPRVTLAVPSYTWQGTASGKSEFEALADLRAQFDLKTMRGVSIADAGTIRWRDSNLTFVPNRCVDIGAAALLQKTHRIATNIAARLCGRPGGDFLTVQQGGWAVNAAWQSLSLRLASAKAKLTSAAGAIALTERDGKLDGTIGIAEARLSDLARARRFAPVAASGKATLKDNTLRGRFALSGAKQKRLGTIALVHDIHTGRGHADIRADTAFSAPDGAQPGDLSPMLVPLAQATGETNFTGHIQWTPRRMTSGGDLTIRTMDFVSPLGKVHGANGHVHFTSLVPPQTAAKQEIAVAKVDWATPLTDLSASFQATPAILQLHGAGGHLADGEVHLGPVSLSLSPGATTEGKITLNNIDAGALVSASNLADKIKLSAHISGTVPFRYGLEGLRFADGYIATVGPGKLAIARSLWSSSNIDAGNGVIRDFAYQALEQLAIEQMDGTVNSLPGGRLGIVLHIKGHNEPEVPKPAEIGIFALIQGHALDKPIPLPKGTEVNLTLDTSLNFDELLAAYRKAWADSQVKEPPEQPVKKRGRSSK